MSNNTNSVRFVGFRAMSMIPHNSVAPRTLKAGYPMGNDIGLR
jgi:hypothetical protein